MTPGLESGALELTPGIGAEAERAKTTFEETDMARSRGGRRAAPRDLLADITAEEPAATTPAKTPAKSQEATRPEALPDIVAELQRIGTQLEALAERSAELSGAVERSANHYWASVRITACPHDRGPSPGSEVFLPMNELLEFDCARMLRDDEDARARLEADVRREIARLDESVARQLLERDRRHGRDIDRGEDYDRSW